MLVRWLAAAVISHRERVVHLLGNFSLSKQAIFVGIESHHLVAESRVSLSRITTSPTTTFALSTSTTASTTVSLALPARSARTFAVVSFGTTALRTGTAASRLVGRSQFFRR